MAYKVFSNGDALTGSELNTYLMNQSVMVFASTTARDAALTAPTEGMVVWLQDANKYVYYTGSAWADLITPASSGNAIINGAFDIWQRGTSVAIGTAFTFGADRWQNYRGSLVAGMTVSRQATGDTTNLPNIQYCARVQRDSGNTATNAMVSFQSFETANSIQFAGKAVTISFYARKGANYSEALSKLPVQLLTGTGVDQNSQTAGFTGQVIALNETATLTTTWQRFSYTATLASNISEIATVFNYVPVGTAGAADYYEITGVQLEAGSTATAFKRNASNIQGELAACQRYYNRIQTGVNNTRIAFGSGANNTTAIVILKTPTTMRVTPTSMDYSGLTVYDGVSAGITVTSAVIDTSSPDTVAVALTASGGGITAYRPYQLHHTTSGYIGFSAEL